MVLYTEKREKQMAYMSQERKAELAPAIRAWCKSHGVKASIAVKHDTKLVVNIKSGSLDFCENYYDNAYAHAVITSVSKTAPITLQKPTHIQVNPYWAQDHFTGDCREFLIGLLELMNIGNHDNSDIQSDYFNVGWYVDVNIGSYNKPYQLGA